VSSGASEEEVKAAVHRMRIKYHPDPGGMRKTRDHDVHTESPREEVIKNAVVAAEEMKRIREGKEKRVFPLRESGDFEDILGSGFSFPSSEERELIRKREDERTIKDWTSRIESVGDLNEWIELNLQFKPIRRNRGYGLRVSGALVSLMDMKLKELKGVG